MDTFLALAIVAVLLVPVVLLVRRPGWGPVRATHPDADRLARDLDAVRARGLDAVQARDLDVQRTHGVDAPGVRSDQRVRRTVAGGTSVLGTSGSPS